MGFCGELVMRRTPEKGTGGSGEGGTTRGQGNFELAANSGYYSRGSALAKAYVSVVSQSFP